MKKIAQLKIQQMTFMLLAVTLLFVIVLLFFISFKFSGLKQDAEELKRDKASILASKIASTPEFIFEDTPNAIDADKLMILQSQTKYKEYFGVGGIIVRKIYPSGNLVECTKGNYPNCNIIKIFTSKNEAPVSTFVAWCTKQTTSGVPYNKCELGLLMIEYEENER